MDELEEKRFGVKISIPEKVRYILQVLEAAGWESYAVGVCVRDAILNRTPGDWDITTRARPEQVKALFPRCIDTGIQHGTVTVLLGKEGFEVTTYRIDGTYQDGRHPDEVFYTTELREDLRRRDFTMNAMAYHPDRGLVDIFGGRRDLHRKIVRCVGEPSERFSEDALRILRAVRFAAQLGFSVEPRTEEALRALAPNLRRVSRERIQTELVKLLMSPHPDQLQYLYDTGILQEILPQLCETAGQGKLPYLERALLGTAPDKTERLAVMLSESGMQAGAILRSLKFDNETTHAVQTLVAQKDWEPDGTAAGVRRLLRKIGEAYFLPLLDVKDALAGADEQNAADALARTALARRQYREILERGECFSLKTLAVSGRDLIAAGCRPGPGLGKILERLLDMVIEHPEWNEKSVLEQKIEEAKEEDGYEEY